ncbi:MAG TPA: hypothetical protein VEU30_01595 [Thermoanaerobaculia bacterium]|nr:hypothetical protein [Thermoanaerobaculia bacterium]
MKKVVAALAVIVVATWAVATLTARGVRRAASAQEWPLGLGTLESVPGRYQGLKTSDAARELELLAGKADAATLRDLLASGRPLVWGLRPGHHRARRVDHRAMMEVHKTLVGSTRDWEDLRAEWQLARALWQPPETVSVMLATKYTSALVDRAEELPGPEPAWFAEVRTFDYRKAMVTAMQHDTWETWMLVKEYGKADPHATGLRRLREEVQVPYMRVACADFASHQRKTAIALVNGSPPPEIAWWNNLAKMAAPNHVTAWQRVVELEQRVKR